MKIIGPDDLSQVKPEVAKPVSVPNRAAAFQKLLAEAAGKTHTGKGVEPERRLTEPAPVQVISHVPQSSVVDQTRRVIDLMDAYASSLSDPGKTLKSIEPLLNQFVEAAEAAHLENADKAAASSDLANILDGLLQTARLEQIRFRRGDYVDA